MNSVNVMALDDDKDAIEMIEETIKSEGITNYKLLTNEDDFENALTDNLSVVVIDHRLNSRSGLDIVKEVRKRNKDSFIIIYTGHKSGDTIIQYIHAGINEWVDKNDRDHLHQLAAYLKKGLKVSVAKIALMDYLQKGLEISKKRLALDEFLKEQK